MSDDEVTHNKRIILNPRKPVINRRQVSLYSPTQQVLADALDTVAHEVTRLNGKARQTKLDHNEAKTLQGYIKSLIDLSKELREIDKQTDLAEMTDEQLLELVAPMLNKVKRD